MFYPTEVHYVATMCDSAAGHREDGGTGAFVWGVVMSQDGEAGTGSELEVIKQKGQCVWGATACYCHTLLYSCWNQQDEEESEWESAGAQLLAQGRHSHPGHCCFGEYPLHPSQMPPNRTEWDSVQRERCTAELRPDSDLCLNYITPFWQCQQVNQVGINGSQHLRQL